MATDSLLMLNELPQFGISYLVVVSQLSLWWRWMYGVG
jgi:hypothetical protein